MATWTISESRVGANAFVLTHGHRECHWNVVLSRKGSKKCNPKQSKLLKTMTGVST